MYYNKIDLKKKKIMNSGEETTAQRKENILNLETLIIATLFENGGGMSLKQIANKNDLPKKYLDKLKNTAKIMIRQRTIFKAKSDLLYISDMRTVFTGKVATLSRTFGFVTNLTTGEDCFVSGGKLKGAVPGDTVIAREVAAKPSREARLPRYWQCLMYQKNCSAELS